MLFLKIPKDIKIKFNSNYFKITGPLGTVIKNKPEDLNFIWKKEENILYLDSSMKNKHFYLSLINNIIKGVDKGYKINLSIIGVGYKVTITEDNNLLLKLGYSNEIIYKIPKNIKIKILNKKILTISIFGCNKQQVSQVAAQIRSLRIPEPYKGKGIRYENEIIKLKEGKKSNV